MKEKQITFFKKLLLCLKIHWTIKRFFRNYRIEIAVAKDDFLKLLGSVLWFPFGVLVLLYFPLHHLVVSPIYHSIKMRPKQYWALLLRYNNKKPDSES